METTVKLLRYLVVVVVVAIFGGLAGWFFFVRSHQSSISAVDTGRGLGEQTPLYTGTTGSSASSVQPQGGSGTSTVSSGPKEVTRLWRADLGPVAGFSFITQPKNASSSAHLYFIERANGYVFDADARVQSITRLTNTLIPKTYEAIFSPKGGTVLLRSIDGGSITTLLASFATPASTTTFPQALGGPALPTDIRTIAVDPDPTSGLLFYLAPGKTGGVDGVLTSLSNTKPRQIFSSPLESWRAQFSGGKVILLLSPVDDSPGYAYTLSENGASSLYVGPIPGLMILSHPTQEALVYSSSSGGRLSLYAQVGKGAPTLLSVQTVAEKCVWDVGKSFILYCAVPKAVPTSGFIDPWYQGALHTSDTWWEIDAENGTASEIFTPESPLDVHDPHIDPSGSYIAFTNGADLSLWVLRIVQ